MVGVAACEKVGFELIELEEAVKNEGGCWVRFMKVPYTNPQAAVAPGGKAAPPKDKKAVPTEEIKPIIGRAWLDLA